MRNINSNCFYSSKKEDFSHMLIRKINEKGMKNSDCYKKARIDRKAFSKIINKNHIPKKATITSFVFALELPLDEALQLYAKAGFTLSDCLIFDQIVYFFIENSLYDLDILNQYLFEQKQPLVGQ